MKKETDKKDYSYLLKTKLPLSKQTYRELQVALEDGHLKWSSLRAELRYAFGDFEKDKREKAWQKGIDEGKWQEWD